MDREQNIVYMQSQLLACQIELQAMIAENMQRQSRGESIPYGENSFAYLFEKYPISHNDVISQLCDKN